MSGLHGMDERVLFFLNHLGADGVPRQAVARLLAAGTLFALGAIVAYIVLRKPDGGQVFVPAIAGFVLAVVIGKALNQIVVRERPFVVFPDDVRHIELIVRPDSFPSIHAAGAFGAVGALLWSRHRRWGLAMLVLTLLMAAARVAAGGTGRRTLPEVRSSGWRRPQHGVWRGGSGCRGVAAEPPSPSDRLRLPSDAGTTITPWVGQAGWTPARARE